MGHNDQAPGPDDRRSLPLAGRLLFSASLISAIGTDWKSVHHSPGSGGAAQPGLAGQGRSVPA